ncbi:Rad21/Rec8 like protein [Rozella allomycis CSF55]|uniref:Rad21/Rec8 like protein n=1 Tax=Rozella allomycis (strain CSF55) TaxID=988480 RepID=A0A075AQW0_ROZAC|nr:Rad21/Rec8-like protein domain-containing protein [Rozella allomycis CSF55]RKP21605.1 Rad21/Rec8 like protein [Rozella allomycis CSF55]|eukprot:EPZ32666.1 Rad21/Rec8-like protein domain-containing protein [Rozella allomycis CSF55]
MFYSDSILTKKGALSSIWLAAHWDRKLSKQQITQTDIEASVEILKESVGPVALRISGHLLLGVVKIYWRKTKYLLDDCNDAFMKIKLVMKM